MTNQSIECSLMDKTSKHYLGSSKISRTVGSPFNIHVPIDDRSVDTDSRNNIKPMEAIGKFQYAPSFIYPHEFDKTSKS